jgi:hypothetical protein
MRGFAATVGCLAAVLALTACATRDKYSDGPTAEQPKAASSVPEAAKPEAQSPGVVQAPVWSPGQRRAGRTALGALGGAAVGALVPIVVFASGGPIGVAVGVALAPAGAAVGAAVGAATGLAGSTTSK